MKRGAARKSVSAKLSCNVHDERNLSGLILSFNWYDLQLGCFNVHDSSSFLLMKQLYLLPSCVILCASFQFCKGYFMYYLGQKETCEQVSNLI